MDNKRIEKLLQELRQHKHDLEELADKIEASLNQPGVEEESEAQS